MSDYEQLMNDVRAVRDLWRSRMYHAGDKVVVVPTDDPVWEGCQLRRDGFTTIRRIEESPDV